MRLRALAFLLGLLTLVVCAHGQTVDLDKDHVPVTVLDGPWRFHTGDDPAWAASGFDDSGWSLLTADRPWTEQGYRGYGGLVWYRLTVVLPARHGPLALYLPSVADSFQLFANGRLLGQLEGMPPRPRVVMESRILLPVPEDLAVPNRRLHLAIRVWSNPRLATESRGGIYPAPRIGDAQVMARVRELEGREVFWQNTGLFIEALGNLLPALASLGLFALRRKEREYLWFGLLLLAWSASQFVDLKAAFLPTPRLPLLIVLWTLAASGTCMQVELYAVLLRQSRRWLYAGAILFAVSGFSLIFAGQTFWPDSALSAYSGWCFWPFDLCLAAMVFRAERRGSSDAKVLLVGMGLELGLSTVGALGALPWLSGLPWMQAVIVFIENGIRWPFPLPFVSLAGDVENLSILAVMLARYARIAHREERMEAELEAARTVQQVLFPAEVPPVRGFAIASVYRPASQVGGDFFQIIPTPDGGLLVVIGDVSGKGMPAAMTVSLLVGTMRTLAHYTQSPGEILAAMNQRMLARNAGGFTTCLALRAEANGTVTVANAGHLAPYRGQAELPIENGLPLGLDAGGTYAESSFHLAEGEQLTLLTDGVVEARGKDGELFGFERTSALAGGSAESIAQTAQSFGQEDDITVLTLTRIGLDEKAVFQLAGPVPSPAMA